MKPIQSFRIYLMTPARFEGFQYGIIYENAKKHIKRKY